MRSFKASSPRALVALALGVALAGCSKKDVVADYVAGDMVVLKKNGGWCWFQDPRAIVDQGRILVGTVAGTTGDGSTAGDNEVTAFDLATRKSTTFKLHEALESDDHDAASLLVLPDGRYLAMYTKHAVDRVMRWRVSQKAGDISAWDDEKRILGPGKQAVTYSNTYMLSAENNKVYSFYRGRDHNPQVMTAPPDIPGFELSGRLLFWDRTEATGVEPEKVTPIEHRASPYVRYASRGVDSIHFITTEDHPIDYDNSIYHGVVRGGAVHDSFGKVVDGNLFDEDAPSPVEFTRVFEGDLDHVAWTTDIELDENDNPVIAFSVQRDGGALRDMREGGGLDHRYHYGRFDGQTWHVHEMAHAGQHLYADQADYTGLVAIDPGHLDTVYISTDADPVTGEPLVSEADGDRHYEIFRGRTSDMGATWTWTPITKNSTTDNVRPNVPKWEGHTAVLWLRGAYHNMLRYEQDVVGLIDPE
ncbi:MAG: BNR-4 repeat-containing protein [Minicystis sp.]